MRLVVTGILCSVPAAGAAAQQPKLDAIIEQELPSLVSKFPTLSAETTDENKPIRLSYGLGWGIYWTPFGKAFFKEGHDEGFRHYVVCFDDAKTGLLIMTNSSNGEGIYKELLETLLRNIYTPLEWERFTACNQTH